MIDDLSILFSVGMVILVVLRAVVLDRKERLARRTRPHYLDGRPE